MIDKEVVDFIQNYASQAAGLALTNALNAQTSMLAAIIILLHERKPLSAEQLSAFGTNIVDPLSRFATTDDAVFKNALSVPLRVYGDAVLKLSETILRLSESTADIGQGAQGKQSPPKT